MRWPYLLVYNDALGSRRVVTDFLDTIPEINYWYASFPNSVFMTSSLSAGQITDRLLEHFGRKGEHRFFITEIPKDRQGWATEDLWHMLRNPDSPRRKGD